MLNSDVFHFVLYFDPLFLNDLQKYSLQKKYIVLNSFSPQNTERRQHFLRMQVFVPISSENQIHVLSLMLNHQNMDLTYCITYLYSLKILCHKYFYTFYIDLVACTLTLQRERETAEMIKRVDFITDDHYLQRNHNPYRFTLANYVPLKKEESTNWERRKSLGQMLSVLLRSSLQRHGLRKLDHPLPQVLYRVIEFDYC